MALGGASPIYVDIYGEQLSRPELMSTHGGRDWMFVFDSSHKVGKKFNLAVFANYSALSPDVYRYPRRMRVAALFESPIMSCYEGVDAIRDDFAIVFTHQESLLEQGEPYRKLLFGTNWSGVHDSDDTERILADHPSKTKLVSFMGSVKHPDLGGYLLRRAVADVCIGEFGGAECFGYGIRRVETKREAIAPFCFSVAMENVASNYYFSEKLVDCVLLETIPIYFGCPGISSLLDARGLISFTTVDEFRSVMRSLSPELYYQMLPFALENKRRLVKNGWHSHLGMLERLAMQIPDAMLQSPRPPNVVAPRLISAGRRVLARLGVKLKRRAN